MSGPAASVACLVLSAAVAAAVYGLCRLASAIRYEAREARHTAAGVAAAREADREAGEYCLLLAGPGVRPPWELPRAGRLEMPPPDPPPADTAEIPVVRGELGGCDVDEFVEAVFARHADGPVMLP